MTVRSVLRSGDALLRGRGLGLALLTALIALRVIDPAPIERLRFQQFDAMQQLAPRETAASPVAILDIDEQSLRRLGQWPWPRDLIAKVVGRLTEYGAAAIGFDVVFPEPDRMSPAEYARVMVWLSSASRAELIARPSNDDVLATVIGQGRVVLGLAS
ncbi:MAG TPA: CHASE2 domain-containing protein, partial [Dongiaceae bacterium]|nr:CHASE2 domain-containing protein [Dongiaceae bacterium]